MRVRVSSSAPLLIMPYLHCNKCHHEYEATNENEKCDWCGSDGYLLEEKTPMEKFMEAFSIGRFDQFLGNRRKEK